MHKLSISFILTLCISTAFDCTAHSYYDDNSDFQNQSAYGQNVYHSSVSNYPSYRKPSYRNQYTQYISDNSNHMPSPVNHGTSNVDINTRWDTTDDQKMRQSSDNTIQSPQWNKAEE